MKKNLIGFVLAVVMGLAFLTPAVFADENVADLKAQVATLQKRVAELEAQHGAALSPPVGAVSGNRADTWDPTAEMQRMRSEMDHMFQDSISNPGIPANGVFSNQMVFQSSGLEQTKDGYLVRLNLKGFDQDQVDIKVNPNSLSVSAKQKQQTKQDDPNKHVESQNFGEFLQTISLPKDADVAKMTTEKKDDELIIHLPRKS